MPADTARARCPLTPQTASDGRKQGDSRVPWIVIYLRVSTDEQAESGLGLEAQLAACRAAAGRLGLEVAFTFEDDVSGGLPLEKRPVLVDAIAALSRGDVLLVAKRDRLSRGDPLTTGMIEAAVQRAGARIVSAAGEGTESDEPSSILMRRIIDAFAEYERLIIKARTRAALRAKKARGERAGQVPYGHHLAGDGRTLEPDPAEAAALALIRELGDAGTSLRAIARELDRRGVPTKSGRPWRHTTIRDLLGRSDANV
jgi:site-specific DNA recombinase